jgi:hypothetical protein
MRERAGLQNALLEILLDHGARIDGLPGGWSPCSRRCATIAPKRRNFSLRMAPGWIWKELPVLGGSTWSEVSRKPVVTGLSRERAFFRLARGGTFWDNDQRLKVK